MPLTRRHFVLKSRDPQDVSDEAFDESLIGTILGSEGCDGLLYERWVNRSLRKAVAALAGEFPSFTDDDVEAIVVEAAQNLTLKARNGTLQRVENPTGLLYVSSKNLILDRLRLKKGKEKLLGSLRSGVVETTHQLFLDLLESPTRRPDARVMRQELLRRVGEQVGGLSAQQREVVCAFREGKDYDEIAAMLNLKEPTIRVHFHDAVIELRQLLNLNPLAEALSIDARRPLSTLQELRAVAALPGVLSRLFEGVHVEGQRISEIAQPMNLGRALAEAILLQGYWRVRQSSGKSFPSHYLDLLAAHSTYERHACPFQFW
jgi:RNA polymerase sigma factor (sigma-70 family)